MIAGFLGHLDSLAGQREAPGVVAVAAPQRAERGEESAACHGVGGGLGQRQCGVEVGTGGLECAENRVRLGARLEQRRPLWSERRGAFAGGQRLVVKAEGFAVGVGSACRRRGEARVAGGVRPRRGFVVVLRQ